MWTWFNLLSAEIFRRDLQGWIGWLCTCRLAKRFGLLSVLATFIYFFPLKRATLKHVLSFSICLAFFILAVSRLYTTRCSK